jgi:hypothetical protein
MTDPSQLEQQRHEGDGFFSREAVSGVPWMVLAKLVLFFVYFGVSVLTVNGLGREKFGIYSLLINLSSYLLVICGMGLGAALMRYVPELAAHKNHRGLIHLLIKSAAMQIVAIGVVAGLLLHFAEPLQRLFNAEGVVHFRYYLVLVCGLVALLMLKDFIATVFTSMFRARTVAVFSVVQGCVWLSILFVWIRVSPEVSTVLYVQMISIGLVYIVGTAKMQTIVQDCSLVGAYFMLSAAARGLGTCWVAQGAFIEDKEIRAELAIPENYTIVAPIIIGYPKQVPSMPPRKDPKLIKVIS